MPLRAVYVLRRRRDVMRRARLMRRSSFDALSFDMFEVHLMPRICAIEFIEMLAQPTII